MFQGEGPGQPRLVGRESCEAGGRSCLYTSLHWEWRGGARPAQMHGQVGREKIVLQRGGGGEAMWVQQPGTQVVRNVSTDVL